MGFPFHYFKYNRAQQSGIFLLLLLIVGLLLANRFVSFSPKKELLVDYELMAQFQKEIDSIQLLKTQKKNQLKLFNPNYITDYKGYRLGMSVVEIDRLLAYRSDGKFVNSAAEFQKVTGVNDSLLVAISPYFKFPKWVEKQIPKAKITEITPKKVWKKKDLNIANASDFQKINGIGTTLSNRIVKYRNLLKGFSTHDQLAEVYGLDPTIIKKLLSNFEIKQSPNIKKLNINTATFKQVLALPYTDFEMTKMIFSYKDQVFKIKTIEDLSQIEGFPAGKIGRLSLYLQVD